MNYTTIERESVKIADSFFINFYAHTHVKHARARIYDNNIIYWQFLRKNLQKCGLAKSAPLPTSRCNVPALE